jgi:hypothetical protein
MLVVVIRPISAVGSRIDYGGVEAARIPYANSDLPECTPFRKNSGFFFSGPWTCGATHCIAIGPRPVLEEGERPPQKADGPWERQNACRP